MEPNYSSFCVHNKFWMCMHSSMRTSKMSVKYVLKQIYFRHENNTFSNFIHSVCHFIPLHAQAKRLLFPCNVYLRLCCLMFNEFKKKIQQQQHCVFSIIIYFNFSVTRWLSVRFRLQVYPSKLFTVIK